MILFVSLKRLNCNTELCLSLNFLSQTNMMILGKFRNLEHDIATMRAKLEEEADMKADLHRQLSRANADVQMYKAKYESEGVARAAELDAARLKLQARLDEAEP